MRGFSTVFMGIEDEYLMLPPLPLPTVTEHSAVITPVYGARELKSDVQVAVYHLSVQIKPSSSLGVYGLGSTYLL